MVLTGVFTTLVVNAAGAAGGWAQLGRQLVLALRGNGLPLCYDAGDLVDYRQSCWT